MSRPARKVTEGMSQPGFDIKFRDLSTAEQFVKRFLDHRHPLALEGCDEAQHREQIRAAHIVATGSDSTIIGRAPDRKPETYAQAFERYYGEPLEPKTYSGKKKEGAG